MTMDWITNIFQISCNEKQKGKLYVCRARSCITMGLFSNTYHFEE